MKFKLLFSFFLLLLIFNFSSCTKNKTSNISFERDTYWKILRHQLTVTGTWNSIFYGENSKDCHDDDWHYVLERLKKKSIKPAELISHRYSIDELDKGMHTMRDKTEDYIKIMMI